MTARYAFKRADGKGAALRTLPNANGALKIYPEIPPTILSSAGYIVSGAEIKGDSIYTLTQTVKNKDGIVVGYINDQWLHVVELSGYVVDGYTAVTHMGKSQGILTDLSNPDPTPPPIEIETAYIVTVDEQAKRVLVKRGDGQPMTGWTVDVA